MNGLLDLGLNVQRSLMAGAAQPQMGMVNSMQPNPYMPAASTVSPMGGMTGLQSILSAFQNPDVLSSILGSGPEQQSPAPMAGGGIIMPNWASIPQFTMPALTMFQGGPNA